MTYKYREEKNGRQTDSFPVDTDDTLWIESAGKSLKDIIEAAAKKWPDVNFEDINIEAVHHHQYCIYYDLHDSSDYVDYIVLSTD